MKLDDVSPVAREDEPEMVQLREKLEVKHPDLDRLIDDWTQFAFEFEEAQNRMSRILTEFAELDEPLRNYLSELEELSGVAAAHHDVLTNALKLPDIGSLIHSASEPPLPGFRDDPLFEFNKVIHRPLEEDEDCDD